MQCCTLKNYADFPGAPFLLKEMVGDVYHELRFIFVRAHVVTHQVGGGGSSRGGGNTVFLIKSLAMVFERKLEISDRKKVLRINYGSTCITSNFITN